MKKKNITTVDKSDYCIKCGICTEHCPVVRVDGRFQGPKQVGPDAQRFRRLGDPSKDISLGLCIGCETCDIVCPSGVNVSELNLMAKAKAMEEKTFSMRNWFLGHLHLIGRLATTIPQLSNRILGNSVFKSLLDRTLAIDRRRRFPAYENQTFRHWYNGHYPRGKKKVAYFYGCHTNTNEIDVGISVVQVLEQNGFEVIVPDQECCGVPLLSQGDFEPARALGIKNVRFLSKIVEDGYDVVFSSTTCGYMMRCKYPGLLKIEGARRLVDRIFDVCEYLMILHEKGELNLDFKPRRERLPYHVPCHLRHMGIGLPALDLLQLIPGIELIDIDAGCCGLGGIYGFKKETYNISMAIGMNIARALRDFEAQVVVSDCEGCRIQIRNLTGLTAVHPVQILRDAYVNDNGTKPS
jgi:glycerol-3-phosphate dehydrogenase subunit C